MISNEDKIKLEKEFISILLKNRNRVNDWLNSNLTVDHFDESNQVILNAIVFAHDHNVLLTKKILTTYLEDNGYNKKEIIAEENMLMRLQISFAKSDDFPILISRILDSYAFRKSLDSIDNFRDNIKKGGVLPALKQLGENVNRILNDSKTEAPIFYQDIVKYAEEYVGLLEKKRSGEIKDYIIKCGIAEIDYTMPKGFSPGNLTLFCADTAHFKTDMMLNIAANIWWDSKKNVLVVPVEMPKEEWFTRFYSRQTGVFKTKLFNPHPSNLTEEEFNKLKVFYHTWKNYESKLFIMEPVTRIDVGVIRREIEKHLHEIKPELVVVDYIGILVPEDKDRKERNDIQIGNMLKELRIMGKKGATCETGFSVVSGAQIGREALKRLHKTAIGGKTSFYSEDLRGSHEYSTDADDIFAQMIDEKVPNRLNIYKIKSRSGLTVFQGGEKRASLELIPEISMIRSMHNDWITGKEKDIYGKLDDISKKDQNIDQLLSEEEKKIESGDALIDDILGGKHVEGSKSIPTINSNDLNNLGI